MVPEDVVLALGDAVSRSSVDDFWLYGVVMLRQVYFGACSLAGGSTAAGSSAFSW